MFILTPSLIGPLSHIDRHTGVHRALSLWWYLLPVGSILLVLKFYWDLGKYANDFIRFGEEYRQAQIVNPNYGGGGASSSSSREALFVAIQSLSKDDMRALLYQVLEHNPLIVQIEKSNPLQAVPCTPCPMTEQAAEELRRNDTTDLISAFELLPAEDREDIINAANGKEYPYRLSCPNFVDTADILKAAPGNASRSVIIGYHVGMLNNWRKIVKDQLNTLFHCGLGAVADHMYISYSNNSTAGEELDQLKAILNQYSFARDATILFNENQPIEGVAINSLHEECTQRVQSMDSPQSDTVAFYFHSKGNSVYDPDWESIDVWYSYIYSLYWRKYMEYFTIERPYLCMKQIFDNGKNVCGVLFDEDHFSGNFWATSCRYLSSLDPLAFYPFEDESKRHDAEMYIADDTNDYFVSLHQMNETRKDLYRFLADPKYFSDYSKVWHPAWV